MPNGNGQTKLRTTAQTISPRDRLMTEVLLGLLAGAAEPQTTTGFGFPQFQQPQPEPRSELFPSIMLRPGPGAAQTGFGNQLLSGFSGAQLSEEELLRMLGLLRGQ